MWLVIFAAAAVLWFFYLGHARPKIPTRPPRIVGNGVYSVGVVGENNYLASFEKICGQRTADCINRKTEAYLILENDNKFDKHAVRVTIEGYTVGYLPRAAARGFRQAVIGVGLGRSSVFECPAHIRSGWDATLRKQENYAVWLDLPAGDVH